MEILKIKNLSKYYKLGDTQIKALDNVSLNINKGEFVSIVGASGSGKSTLLHIIGTVESPSSGNIFFNNEDITNLPDEYLCKIRRNKIGLVYQFNNLIPTLNVEENISLPVLLDNKVVDKKHLDDIISILHLESRRFFLPNQLSGGEQQRVAIGRCLIYSPTILLADEPTGNLDSKNSDEIIKLLKDLNRSLNQTLVFVTHNLEIAKQADRIIELKDGKIISDRFRK